MNIEIEHGTVLEKTNEAFESGARIIINQGGTGCFGPDQLIVTNRGPVKISDVKIGDQCLSYNFGSGESEYRAVIDVIPQINTKKCLRVRLKNGKEIIATEDHRFFINNGWYELKHIVSLYKKNMETIWKQIPKFSGYEASNTGLVRSLNYKRSGEVRILKPALQGDGYLQTMLLRDDGKYKSMKVHWFVTAAFFGPKPDGYDVNHKDCNKQNNNIDNLEYCTRSENMKHAYANGLTHIVFHRGSLNRNAKLTESQVKEIREVAASRGRHYGRKELAESYGVSECCIKEIISRRHNLWSHV